MNISRLNWHVSIAQLLTTGLSIIMATTQILKHNREVVLSAYRTVLRSTRLAFQGTMLCYTLGSWKLYTDLEQTISRR